MPRSGSGAIHKHNASKVDHAYDGVDQADVALKGRYCYMNDLRARELNNFWGNRYHILDQGLLETTRDPKWGINLRSTIDSIDLAFNKQNSPQQTQI